ncbi:TetR family transcriptional regulator [Marmoricola endophyticus]|uniref:TetR family transcriptional regulator n=1 Tax=Marmoricola endophyticus TaxID=2040280 RepID=A0A917BK90_9ACTN|nr:TetR family transcriptional regulator [Marmoricola endophyticus]
MLRRAVELFNRQGYDGTSMSDLARELGVSKSAIYHHVESREDLLRAGLDEGLDALSAAIESAAAGPGSAGDRLRAALRESVLVLAAHLPAVTLLLRVRGNSGIEQQALRRRRELDDRLAALVSAAAEEGVVRRDLPPELVSRLLFGTVNSLVEWYRPSGTTDPASLADAVAAIAFEGITAH